MKGTKRIEYLDVVKGIGIILVVWAHAKGTYSSYIYQFHMPLFFLVSGYLYSNKKPVKEFILSKIKSLYLPFIICNLAGTFVKIHTGLMNNGGIKTYIRILLTLDKDGVFFGATWFLGSLFVVSILYRIIDDILFDYENRAAVLLIFFAMIGICGLEHTFRYMISRTMILSFFFAAGQMIKTVPFPELKAEKKWLSAGLALLLFVFLARENAANMGKNTYTYPMAFVLESFLASYVVVILSQGLDSVSVLKPLKNCLMYLGKMSIDIVIWQFVAFRAVIALQLYINEEPLSTILDYYPCYDASGIWKYVYTVVGIVGSILIGQVLRGGVNGLCFLGKQVKNKGCEKK